MINRSQIILTLFIGIGLVIFSCEEKEEPIVEEEIQETVRDIDGNEYDVVTILGVKWLHQNLRTSKYRDGREIPEVQDNLAWSELTTGAYSWYDNENTADLGHGKLYNWEAATCCDICPEGFKVPTKEDFERIRSHIGGFLTEFNDAWDIVHHNWITRASMLEGHRLPSGSFARPKEARTGFWTSQVFNEARAVIYELESTNSQEGAFVGFFKDASAPFSSGFSIKCVEEN